MLKKLTTILFFSTAAAAVAETNDNSQYAPLCDSLQRQIQTADKRLRLAFETIPNVAFDSTTLPIIVEMTKRTLTNQRRNITSLQEIRQELQASGVTDTGSCNESGITPTPIPTSLQKHFEY